MNKIEKLLKELCPNGVEFKKLDEIFDIKNGYTPSKANKDFWNDGTIPWFRMDDIRTNGRILSDSLQHITKQALKGGKIFPKNSIIISTTATIGEHALVVVDSMANQQFTYLSKKANCDLSIDMKFIYYYCFILGEWCKQNTNISGFASVDMKSFKKFQIPIPPLEVQEEIVKILDTFTKLEAELEAELEARRRQYEYYRNKLLSFEYLDKNGGGYELKMLGEVCEIANGRDYRHLNNGNIPVYGTGGKMLCVDNFLYEGESVCIGRKGTIDKPFYLNEKFWAVDTLFFTKNFKNYIIPKFLFYIFTYIDWKQHNQSLDRPSLTKVILEKIQIPIPSLKTQEKIVSILDKFHTLTTDLQSGIPAEIKARKKQYEYYRNKLLTF
ncbi:hypothetical protein A7X81_07930 [Campylobacter ornithocola]|uniref:Uncharacterized protein n=1 Tax=Campylobacter ornithocola TaxID=1848766 RepID=A0A6M8MR41_9BACT|nr:restriction endonuclease subunit S [Campylobacter ornithocola]OCX43164.1 hypothetical protein A7X81_07930 [Campylobacter ornithocola]QKF56932.1 type I restriction/modification system, specificity subunit [Campylobacter ornithocola]